MRRSKNESRFGRMLALGLSGALFMSSAGCELGDFTTTTTTTLSAQDVVTYFVRSLIITPLDNFVTSGIEAAFSEEED